MRVLVSGATGFVGGHLIGALRRSGYDPLALVRPTSSLELLTAADVPSVTGDLGTGVGLDDALEGVEAIVHCAGGGRVRRVEDFYLNNTRTTETLAEAAVRAGVEAFVLLSSYAAHGPGSDQGLPGPGTPPAPLSHYGRSKLAAENHLRELSDRMRTRVVRAPGLHGAGERRLIPLLRAARRGLMVVPSSGGAAAWLHVGDLSRALVSALGVTDTAPCTYLVDDGHVRSLDEFIQIVAATMEARPRIVRVPGALVTAAAVGSELKAALTGKPVAFTRDKVKDLLASPWSADTGSTREALDWSPQRSLEQGLRELRQWGAHQGLL